MTSKELLTLKVGVALTKGITPEIVRAILERGVELTDFFRLPACKLAEALCADPRSMLQLAVREEALVRARKELEFMERHHIRFLFLGDDQYPYRLAECEDAPVGLFAIGEANLNAMHSVAVVGTRRITPYGESFTSLLVEELKLYVEDLTVVSGLAYGVDACAHKSSLKQDVPTIAVVAHGLDTIYPAQHRDLASKIISAGGAIVSEYPSGVKAFRSNFLARNRIVAGLTDATIVVESDLKGGAMSTANMAFSYGREVMALPGRITDTMSNGCNRLIFSQKASLITGAADMLETLGWRPMGMNIDVKQRNLFPELDPESQVVIEELRRSRAPLCVDEIRIATALPIAQLLGILGELEFEGILVKLPGNRYQPAL